MCVVALGGAGAICREATRDLASSSDFDEIVVAEQDVAAVNGLVALIGDSRLEVLRFAANDYQEMLRTFRAYDVIMNGLSCQSNLPVNRACVEVEVSGLDFSSEDPRFPAQRFFGELARRGIQVEERIEERGALVSQQGQCTNARGAKQ